MRPKARRFIFTFILIAWSGGSLFSQFPRVISYVTEDGIFLRWKGVQTTDLNGYHVYRQIQGRKWVRITTTPLRKITSYEAMKKVAGDNTGKFLRIFGINNERAGLNRYKWLEFIKSDENIKKLELDLLNNHDFSRLMGQAFTDTKVPKRVGVQYRVTVILAGKEIDVGTTETLVWPPNDREIENNQIPSILEISAIALDGAVQLSWKKDQEAIKSGKAPTFEVYRGVNSFGPFLALDFTPDDLKGDSRGIKTDGSIQVFTDDSLVNGKPYYYHIRSKNAFGFQGIPSNIVEVTPGVFQSLEPPKAIRPSLAGSKVKLTWKAPEREADGYEIFRSFNKQEFIKVFELKEAVTSWIDKSIEEGGDYAWFMRSLNSEGIAGEASDTIYFSIADITAPSAPKNLKAEVKSGEVVLTWDANLEKDIFGYEIERTVGPEFSKTKLLNRTALRRTTYSDRIPTNAVVTYGYYIYAIDKNFNRSEASALTKALVKDEVAPQVPLVTSVIKKGKTATLKWEEGTDSDISMYQIWQADRSANVIKYKRLAQTSTLYYNIALEGEGEWMLKVSSIDESGNESEPSKPVSLMWEFDKYPKLDGKGKCEISPFGMYLTWEPSQSKTAKGYYITRIDLITGLHVDVAEINIKRSSFMDKSAEKGRKYNYEVRTRNKNWQMGEPLILQCEVDDSYVPE